MCLAACVCGCSAGSSRDGAGDLASQLADREFLSDSIQGHTLVAGTKIRIHFGDGELSAYAGCNHMSGTFVIEGGVLRITGLGSTEIGCEPALSAQDAWLSDLLTSSPTIGFEDPQLTLASDGDEVVLIDREIASPDRPLVGTDWIGNGMGDEMAITFAPGSGLVTLSFAEDGTVAVFTACQDGTGTFTADATTIDFGRLAYDDVTCEDASLEAVAAAVQLVLDGSPVSYAIDEANLTVKRAGHVLLFRADE